MSRLPVGRRLLLVVGLVAALTLVAAPAGRAGLLDGLGTNAAATWVLSPTATTVGVGGTTTIHGEYDSDGATTASKPQYIGVATFTSSNPLVATVTAGGVVTAVAPGTTTITGTHLLGKTATAVVTVAGTQTVRHVTTVDGDRTYTLYVPDGLPAGAVPLVVDLHGAAGTGNAQLTLSQMNVAARAAKVLVAYPDGQLNAWNAGKCCTSYVADDVGFVSTVIDDVSTVKAVAPKRVYAAGISLGSMMAYRLACQLSTRIAAIGVVSGGMEPGGSMPTCTPTRPVSVLHFHGLTDKVDPYAGGLGSAGYSTRPVETTLSEWRALDGVASATPTTVLTSGIVTCTSWANATAEVQRCLIAPPVPDTDGLNSYDGGGHAWPRGVRYLGGDTPTPDVDASARMLAFFAAHPIL